MKNFKVILFGLLFVFGCSKKDDLLITKDQLLDQNKVDTQAIKTANSSFEVVTVDPRLKSNGKGVITVPVVIVNFLPTTDNVYIDRMRAFASTVPWDAAHIYTLQRAKDKILADKIIFKNAIEEGTKWHDYATNTTRPYVNIDVVAYINVKDVILKKVGTRTADTTVNPTNKNMVTFDWNNIDFNELFTRINLQNYVESLGVKEVWFNYYPREAGINSYNVAESNMSAGTISDNTLGYGGKTAYDVSNSDRSNIDLPRYKNTYVVYGCNEWRGVDTDLHNRGHQLESQLTHVDINNLLWYTGFTPRDSAGGVVNRPRMGNTHYVPNSTKSYDYWQTSVVKSDIMTWKPSGGTYVNINSDTWLKKKYTFESTISMITPNAFASGTVDYSQDAQTKWMIFWWQSIPGYNNNVTDVIGSGSFAKNIKFNNWWDIFYNWDNAMKNNIKIY